jgi:hypothetical protein
MPEPTTSRVALSDLLTVPEIASWQVPESFQGRPRIVAALPALQRGAVWKPQQIEALWDSLVRGFPVGSFLIAPFDPDRGLQKAKHQQRDTLDPTHHLLDGQQRSTGIALGFLNPWTTREEVKAALWVDLAEPAASSDMAFVFRVVTHAHPWGYNRIDPSSPITANAKRQAMKAYRQAAPAEFATTRPNQFPLSRVWPFEAELPIPVSLLIEEIKRTPNNDADFAALIIQRLVSWGDGNAAWQQGLVKAFESQDEAVCQRLQTLIGGFRNLLNGAKGYRIPIQALPEIPRAQSIIDGKPDPVETLFIRVNQAGTRLEGEELIYSILKSEWAEAPTFIEKMQHQLALPSRLVILSSRLVLAKKHTDPRPPAAPDVSRFRRLMHGNDKDNKDFKDQLKSFTKNEGHDVFRIAKTLLTEGPYALPPVLATELAQSSPAVIFLLLRWIMRMREQKQDPRQLLDEPRKMLLGFVTALGWFAENAEQAVAAVWPHLQEASGNELINFFSAKQFDVALQLGAKDSLRMLPLISPDILQHMIEVSVTSGRRSYGGFRYPTSDFWRNWSRWEWLSGRLSGNLERWFTENFAERWYRAATAGEERLDLKTKYQEAWTSFIDGLWAKKSILLYAQRHSLNSWFPDYDPSLPDQLDDMNRPWDWDHIHPQSFLRNDNGNRLKNIPTIIRDWHGSIGNLRAWPLELNRSDRDSSPRVKLNKSTNNGEVAELEKSYGVHNLKAKKSASFTHQKDWSYWQESVPEGDFIRQYLAYPTEYGEPRKALIRAITTRFVDLYREWYKTLEIGQLMSRPG